MIKLLILIFVTSCSSTLIGTRNPASYESRTKWEEAAFDSGWCLQVDKDLITSLLPEIYLVEEYDREVYFLSRYIPVQSGQDFFENLTYEQIPTSWKHYGNIQVSLKAAHSKFQRVKCPRFI